MVYTAHTPLATLLSCELALQRHLTHVSTHARAHSLTRTARCSPPRPTCGQRCSSCGSRGRRSRGSKASKTARWCKLLYLGSYQTSLSCRRSSQRSFATVFSRYVGLVASPLRSALAFPLPSTLLLRPAPGTLVWFPRGLISTLLRLLLSSLTLFLFLLIAISLQVRRTAQTPLALVVRCLHAHSLCARCSLHQLTCILHSVAPLNSILSPSHSLHSTHSFIQLLYEYEIP